MFIKVSFLPIFVLASFNNKFGEARFPAQFAIYARDNEAASGKSTGLAMLASLCALAVFYGVDSFNFWKY